MEEWKLALKKTIPILPGYLFLGIAYASLALELGHSPLLIILASIVLYAGSMQFALVSFLSQGMGLHMIGLMTLLINGRFLVYGFPFIDLVKKMGLRGIYFIFALSDETFSVALGVKDYYPEASPQVYVKIGLLDQVYWVLGTVMGLVLHAFLDFPVQGIDFSMTALFMILVLNQWQAGAKLPVLLGAGIGGLCLVILGPKYFLLPTILGVILSLVFLESKLGDRAREVLK